MSSNNNNKSKSNTIPLVDMTREEYDDLCHQVNDLTVEEAQLEWMESCRYGELDVVRALASCEKFYTTANNDDNSNDDNKNDPITSLVRYVQPTTLNTGLHMAAANNHLPIVRYLLEDLHHPFTTNAAGNTPLHWSASNGHGETVEYLTTNPSVVEVDVLLKNSAGRSALTEGFTSQKEAVVKALLEHDTASEEKLLSAGVPIPTDNDNDDNDDNNDNSKASNNQSDTKKIGGDDGVVDKSSSHIHHFFNVDRPLLIRELAMTNADNPFADDDRPDQDTTGLSIWSASLVCARWMIDLVHQRKIYSSSNCSTNDDNNDDSTNKDSNIAEPSPTWTALELGSGCGVPGLALASAVLESSKNRIPREKTSDDVSTPSATSIQVYLTDLNPQTVDNAKYNIELNKLSDHCQGIVMNWDDENTWPTTTTTTTTNDKKHATYDVVVGSDLIYQKSLVPLLTSVIQRTVKKNGGVFLYVAPDTGRDGLDLFIDQMKAMCPKWTQHQAPPEYLANPLTNGDDEECFLHFQELYQKTYILYEFPF